MKHTLLSMYNRFRWPYLLTTLVIYIILHLTYEPITLGFDLEDITTLALPLLIGLIGLQLIIKAPLYRKIYGGHGLVGVAWAFTFPLLFHWSYSKPFYFYEFSSDFLFALTAFISLTLLQYGLARIGRFLRLSSICFALIDWLLLLIPLGQIGYYVSTWHCLTPATLMALYQTNPEEAFGFLKSAAGIPGLIGIVIGLALLFWYLYHVNYCLARFAANPISSETTYNDTLSSKTSVLWRWLLTVIISIYTFGFLLPGTYILRNWSDVTKYMHELQQYNTLHHDVFDSLQINEKTTAAQRIPGTIILVIGESASRNYMKVYNPDFPYEDTPWQSEEASNPNFIFFNHAYSSYVQTVPTLERALTERNQYDDAPFLQSANIMDVAKKAGYTTYWLSNQGVYGEYDTAISLIAKTSDHTKWAHESYMFSDKYDGVLLPLLQEVPKDTPNFIVIHIMGSHIYYNDRYPHEFSKWKVGEVPKGMEAYANSQLYTDWVLKSIYNYAKEHLNLQAMIYFSDHGESLHLSHNPDIFDFDMARIPFWIYLSPQYQAAYPATAQLLRQREHQYFTNDLLYDTVSGLLQAPSNRYDAHRDLSNPAYKYNKNNLTTLLGQQPLTNDPEVDK